MSSLSDVDWIFLVLAILYFFEMLVWVRPSTVAFATSFGRFGSSGTPRRLIGNDRGNLVLAGPSPSDVLCLVHSIPLSISSDGVVSFVAAAPLQNERPPQTSQFFSWDQLRHVKAVDYRLMVDDVSLCELGTTSLAQQTAEKLRELAALEPSKRQEAMERWRQQRHCVEEARQRWHQWLEATVAVRIGAMLLFAWICPIGLLLVYSGLPIPNTGWVVAGYMSVFFSLWWGIAIVGFLAHRYLYPERKAERYKQLAYSLLSPAVPLRLADALGHQLFGTLHPLAVSAAVDSQSTFRATAERVIRDARFPRLPEEPAEGDERAFKVVRESRQADLECLKQILQQRQLDEVSVLVAPAAEDAAELSYCPRCLHSFVRSAAVCEQCGGRESVAY